MKNYEWIFIDLDETLLKSKPGKQFHFAVLSGIYFHLAKKFGYIKSFHIGKSLILSMLKNKKNSGFTNFEQMIQKGFELTQIPKEEFRNFLNIYYDDCFPKAFWSVEPVLNTKDALDSLKINYKLALVTNPIWPERSVKKRLEWAGIDPNVFSFITHSEKMHSCKPDLEYYEECLYLAGCTKPESVLMIGDSVSKDLPAQRLGIDVKLLTSSLTWADIKSSLMT